MHPDISIVITFHDEGVQAIAALDSMKDNVDVARAEGLVLETRAILDSASSETRHLVYRRGHWLDAIDEYSFSDLGLSRNIAATRSKGMFIAFLDGDDLWGERWITDAYRCAKASKEPAIWHPEYLYFFDDEGFNQHSMTTMPHPYCRASYGLHVSSDSPDFDHRSLIFSNAWTANALAPRDLHLQYPYDAADLDRGIGFEDWGWNIKTLSGGIAHLVVKSTLHAVRRHKANSLSAKMMAAGALPIFPECIRLPGKPVEQPAKLKAPIEVN